MFSPILFLVKNFVLKKIETANKVELSSKCAKRKIYLPSVLSVMYVVRRLPYIFLHYDNGNYMSQKIFIFSNVFVEAKRVVT